MKAQNPITVKLLTSNVFSFAYTIVNNNNGGFGKSFVIKAKIPISVLKIIYIIIVVIIIIRLQSLLRGLDLLFC